MKIVGITKCPTGIAHTYMAAEKIEKACQKLGYTCKVETQGSQGTENTLTAADIAAADYVLIAADVAIDNKERFNGKMITELPIKPVIKDAEQVLQSLPQTSKKQGGFCFPFGSTVNQNGTAINVTTCVLFSAQVYGIDFTFTELITIIGLALISSIGCAGVPAGGTIFTLMILSQFGIPTDAFGLIIASYTLVDVMSTTMNICGDMVCAMVVCKSEKVLDDKVWAAGYDPEKMQLARAKA